MKRKKSVWMLLAHSSIYKVAVILLGVLAVQCFLFWFMLSKKGEVGTLEEMIEKSHTLWVCAAGFLLLTAALCLTGCELSNRPGYTIKRLSVTEQEFFISQSLYNCLCFVIFWAGQAMSALICSQLYLRFADTSVVTGQTVFLAFYRNNWWHSLLPMADVSRTIRNVVLVIALGISSAAVPVYQRRRRMALAGVALLVVVMLYFARPMGDFTNDMIVIVVSGTAAVMGIAGIRECIKEEIA